eukprot:9591475-Karenia_brevis.AAC.1
MPVELPGLETTLAYCAADGSDDELCAGEGPEEASVGAEVWSGQGSLWHQGREVVFTDGACSNNQDPRFRRAGVGIFWSRDDTRNVSMPLPG